jgi:hypothetical protein
VRVVWVVLLASGCASYDSVEDACPNHVTGERHGSPEADELFQRVSCYRRYVGLDKANIHRRVDDATAAHASYLTENETLSTTGQWTTETPGEPGFTGANAFERLEDAGYLGLDPSSAFVWEVLTRVDEVGSYSEHIDELMVDPFVRDVLLAPAWEGAGYAEGLDPALGAFAYWNIVLYFPSGARATRPVTYPQDGQTGLPTSWSPPDPADPALAGVPPLAGFPVTLTFGSSQISANGTNPLDVLVTSSTLTGPEGQVDHQILLPGLYSLGVNWSTAILVPLEPLQPGATYTVVADVSWIDRPQGQQLELSFTTEN